MNKRGKHFRRETIITYLFMVLLVGVAIGFLSILDGNFTGFAIYSQFDQSSFDEGTYINTTYNGSAVVLAGTNLTGTYISKIFDAGNDAVCNNMSWVSTIPEIEFLFCVDGGGEIYKSKDLGVNWVMTQENYGRTTATTDMFSNRNYLYTLSSSGNEVWRSINGSGFAVIYNSFSASPLVGNIDKFITNQNLYVAISDGKVYKSSDNGVSWNLQGDFNPGTQTPKGIAVNSQGDIFAVDGTGAVYKSINDGVDWSLVNSGYGGETATDGMESDINDNLYILLDKKVYKSTNGGVDWNIINNSFTSYTHNGMKILIDINNNFFIADSIGRIFQSYDSGVSWNELGDCNGGASNDILGLTDFIQSTNLTSYARSCDDSECSGEEWVEISNPLDLGLSDNRYFQYKLDFISPDSLVTPIFTSMEIDYTLPPEEVYVDDDFNSETEGWGITHFKNINDALSAVSEGGIISVAEGIYNEKLIISKSVEIIGNGFETTIINGGASGNVIEIATENVNISGFNITGSGTGWNDAGIYLNGAGDCIINNNSLNGNNRGLYILNSYGNLIHSNYIINSGASGVRMSNWATINNFIYNNYFYNSDNWYGTGHTNNYFNISKTAGINIVGGEFIGGNFWSDYSGNNRGDGFGDSSYNVEGNYYDYLPLLDNSAPIILIISPADGNSYGYNESLALNFSVSDSDDNLESCWYNLDYGENITLVDCANTTFDVSEGSHILNIYANDSNGEEASDSVNFNVQVGAPSISLSFPINTYLNYSENIYFNYTPEDVDLDYCELWGDFDGEFKLNQTNLNPNNAMVNSFILDLNDGEYLWNIKCFDDIGNSAFNGNQTFYIDTTKPSLILTQPTGVKTSRIVSASWSVTDLSPVTCKYNVYRGSSIEIANTSVNCALSSTSFAVTVDADFVFNFYVNDSAGNYNFTTSSFSVNTGESPPPSSGGGGSSGSGSVSITTILGLEIFELSPLIVNSGETKTISLKVKNTGNKFLNECKFSTAKEFSNWIDYTKMVNLAAGEEYEFIFDVNVPPKAYGKNVLGIFIGCKEINKTGSIILQVIEKKFRFELLDIERSQNDMIKFYYLLEELSGTNQNVELQFILFGEGNEELVEVKEIRDLSANDLREFDVTIPIDSFLEGDVDLLVNLNSEVYSTFFKENILLGTPISGFAIGENSLFNYNNFFIVLFVLGFLIFVFLIVRKMRTSKKRVKKILRKK